MAENLEIKVKVTGADKAERDLKKVTDGASAGAKKATKDISEWGIATKAVMANLAVDGAQFLGRELASTVGEFFNFEEGLVSVRKTVGFTKEEMKTFGDQILQIGADSRTSYDELLNIATIGGQLGISKGEILDFTFAIDKLNVALGDEFLGGASEITDSVGGLNLIFREFKGRPMADGLLLIGNALNKLGAEGMATAPIVSEFARRIAGSAVPLGMTAADILGLSAALQELQVAPERGSSTITRVMAEMGKNIDDFAKVAGKSSSEFAEIYNTDVNEALLLVAKGIRENSTNNVELIETLDELGVDGVFATEVLGKLGENIDFVRGKQELANVALQDSNSIMDEYNLRNETGQAQVEKLGKEVDKLKIKIGEALAPTLLSGVEALNQLISGQTFNEINDQVAKTKDRDSMTGANDLNAVMRGNDFFGKFNAMTNQNPFDTRKNEEAMNQFGLFSDMLVEAGINYKDLGLISDNTLRKIASESRNVNEWIQKIKTGVAEVKPIAETTFESMRGRLWLLRSDLELTARVADGMNRSIAAGSANMTIGAVSGAYKAIGKYADGGIVPGHLTSGDKVLARVNSGEMILSGDQQAGLMNMIREFAKAGKQGVVNNFNAPITFGGQRSQSQEMNIFNQLLKAI